MTYIELLQHPFWQQKRLRIFERDNWTCRRCTDKFTMLQVHHLYYNDDALPWEYDDSALLTLCDLCHKKAEFHKWLSRHIHTLKNDGFIETDRFRLRALISERLDKNMHRESALQYIDDIKKLLYA